MRLMVIEAFNGVDWRWQRFHVVADNLEQALGAINGMSGVALDRKREPEILKEVDLVPGLVLDIEDTF